MEHTLDKSASLMLVNAPRAQGWNLSVFVAVVYRRQRPTHVGMNQQEEREK
jgi:hypothetical protein